MSKKKDKYTQQDLKPYMLSTEDPPQEILDFLEERRKEVKENAQGRFMKGEVRSTVLANPSPPKIYQVPNDYKDILYNITAAEERVA